MEAKIRLERFGIDRLEFRCDHAALEELSGNIRVNISIRQQIAGSLSGRVIKITLPCSLRVEDPNRTGGQPANTLVELVVDYFGTFSFVLDDTADLQKEREEIVELLRVNGTAILFPYLRAAVTSISAAAGIVPPFVLPTVNVFKLLDTTESSIQISD